MRKTLKTMMLFALPLLLSAQIAPGVSVAQMEHAIDEAQELTNDLDDDFDDAMDQTALDGTDEEERLDRQMEALEDTMDQIDKKFHDRGSFVEMRSLTDRALRIAEDINRVMIHYRFGKDVDGDWVAVRDHLNTMARYYDLRPIATRSVPARSWRTSR